MLTRAPGGRFSRWAARQREVNILSHLSRLLSCCLVPTLPPRTPHGVPVDLDVCGRERIASLGWDQRRVGPDVVAAATQVLERLSRLPGSGVTLPVHRLGIERPVEALQQPELGRRAVKEAAAAALTPSCPSSSRHPSRPPSLDRRAPWNSMRADVSKSTRNAR